MAEAEAVRRAGLLEVDTPEGLRIGLELAGVGERLGALAIDLAILGPIYALFVFIVAPRVDAEIVTTLALFVLRYGYFLGFELTWQGATPGKRILRLKAVARDGGSLDGRAIAVRNLMRDVELFFPLQAVLGGFAVLGDGPRWLGWLAFAWLAVLLFLPLFNRMRARVGDLLAGTVVVRMPRPRFVVDEAMLDKQRASKHRIQPEHLIHYGVLELERLAELLREIDPTGEREGELFLRVAETIATRVGYPIEHARDDPEGFLRAFYGAQRSFLERQLLFGRRKSDKHHQFERV
jgi:uncharacterized RDD family membrane protein YckC